MNILQKYRFTLFIRIKHFKLRKILFSIISFVVPGEIEVNPSYGFGSGVKIAYKTTINGKEDSKTFPETDHFGGETEYFSECILNNVDPEADGEEGLLDVRVIVAIKDSLKGNGKTIKLEPRQRSKHPTLNQVKKLSLAKQPSSFIGRDSQKPSTDL